MDKREVRIVGVNVGSIAMFEGLFLGLIGFVVALAAWLGLTYHYTVATNSLLRGMLWGLAPGLGALILDTIIYFVAGLILGLIHGGLFNLVTSWMGGIGVATRDASTEAAMPTPSQQTATRRAEPTFGETVNTRRDR
jgi:hypothetical protein